MALANLFSPHHAIMWSEGRNDETHQHIGLLTGWVGGWRRLPGLFYSSISLMKFCNRSHVPLARSVRTSARSSSNSVAANHRPRPPGRCPCTRTCVWTTFSIHPPPLACMKSHTPAGRPVPMPAGLCRTAHTTKRVTPPAVNVVPARMDAGCGDRTSSCRTGASVGGLGRAS